MAAGAGKKMGGGVPALGWWLMVVGAVRLAVTWSGFFDAAALGSATYAHAQGALAHPIRELDLLNFPPRCARPLNNIASDPRPGP
jgi:hypothetical protein